MSQDTDDKTAEGEPAAAPEPVEAAAPAADDTGGEEPAPADEAAAAPPPPSPEERVAALEAEVETLKDQLLRALAETQNVRRRAERDRVDASRYAVSGFARDMLAVADNLRRAVDSVEPDTRAADPAVDALMTGVEMTERALLGAFERHGITPMEALDKPFDPNVHEAMFELEDLERPAGTVVQVMETGYMIHDRPLRPARVAVSRGGPKEAPAATEEEATDAPAKGGATAYEKPADTSGSRLDEEL